MPHHNDEPEQTKNGRAIALHLHVDADAVNCKRGANMPCKTAMQRKIALTAGVHEVGPVFGLPFSIIVVSERIQQTRAAEKISPSPSREAWRKRRLRCRSFEARLAPKSHRTRDIQLSTSGRHRRGYPIRTHSPRRTDLSSRMYRMDLGLSSCAAPL